MLANLMGGDAFVVLFILLLPLIVLGTVIYFAVSRRGRTSGPGVAPSGPIPAGWNPDPARRHQLRYWDGRSWTESVSDGGTVSTDPL